MSRLSHGDEISHGVLQIREPRRNTTVRYPETQSNIARDESFSIQEGKDTALEAFDLRIKSSFLPPDFPQRRFSLAL